MEDRYVVIRDFHMGYSLFAVFDGHGGSEIADFCKENLPWTLRNMMDHYGIMDMRTILDQTFMTLNKSVPEGLCYMCGTTALVMLMHQNHVWVANCGDSRAIMNIEDRVKSLTSDHKPGQLREKRRIEALGGHVINVQGVPRVIGELAVSRSIGDRRYHPLVTAKPDVYYHTISPSNKFFVLATDGLWDVMNSTEVNRFVWNTLSNNTDHPQPYQTACTQLMTFAYQRRDAEDNMTIIVIGKNT
jgi:protein phosphatase 2C